MKSQIVSVSRYLRATPYGFVLVFTAFYNSGSTRKFWLRNNSSNLWSESLELNCSLVTDLQRAFLPATVLRFIDRSENEGFDTVTLFRPSSATSVVKWETWE